MTAKPRSFRNRNMQKTCDCSMTAKQSRLKKSILNEKTNPNRIRSGFGV